MNSAISALESRTAAEALATHRSNVRARIGLVALVALFVLALPTFLRSPLWADALTFDCYVKIMDRGGTLYGDAFEVNLPGMAWFHWLVRSTLGWSDLAIRSVDVAVIFGFALMATRWLTFRVTKIWLLVGMMMFYFSSPETYHCQRDFWMLLPMFMALESRLRVNQSLAAGESAVRWTVLEGLAWGVAIWIKPYAILAIPPVLLVSGLALRSSTSFVRIVGNLSLLAAVGLSAGGIGVFILWASGSLPGFMEIMLQWRPAYQADFSVADRLERFLVWQTMYAPWSLLLIFGFAFSCVFLFRTLRAKEKQSCLRDAILSSFFMGWLFQAFWVQHLHVYVIGAVVPVAIVVLFVHFDRNGLTKIAKVAVPIFLVAAVFISPIIQPQRTAQWTNCIVDSESDELRDRLGLVENSAGETSWQQLRPVIDYLRQQEVKDGEVTCFHISGQPIYIALDVKPSTRYVAIARMAINYRSRFHEVARELANSNQRFVVSDLLHTPDYDAAKNAQVRKKSLPPLPRDYRRAFPWNEPVVFRSGRYVVHKVVRLKQRLAEHRKAKKNKGIPTSLFIDKSK